MKAYIFPGQGAQFPGMAKELYGTSPRAREMFEMANEILGFRITDTMFEGSSEDLKATKVTQPAIFLHSVILAECLEIHPDMVAGHSLGEFSALVAAKALQFEDALKLVYIRAIAMQKCCEKVPGGMAAIIGLSDAEIEEICCRAGGLVIPANYNCDSQVVISGEREAVAKACESAKKAGAKRALPLAVGGAFHSPLMKPAGIELGKAIKATKFTDPICPVYQNVSTRAETKAEVIKQNLLEQLSSPVKWAQSVRNMLVEGADDFCEIGPGTVLQGLVKRIAGGMVRIESRDRL